jgi:hypothetical protein
MPIQKQRAKVLYSTKLKTENISKIFPAAVMIIFVIDLIASGK